MPAKVELRAGAIGDRLSDNAPAGFFASAADGTIQYLNATLAQWLGLDLAEIAGRPLKLSEIMSSDNASLVASAGRGQAQGATTRFDIDLIKADGTNLPVRILHRLPRNGASVAAHTLVINRSAGEAEEAGSAELRFARLFHAAPIAIATIDAEGCISATNASFMRLFCQTGDDTGMAALVDLADPDDRADFRKTLDQAIAGEGLIEPLDFTFASDKERKGRFYLSPMSMAKAMAKRQSLTPSRPPSSARSSFRWCKARRCRPSVSSLAELPTISITC